MYNFGYLIDKIERSPFETQPFKHIYIDDFFTKEHFDLIISSNEISSPAALNDEDLINGLIKKGFKPIAFPGSVTDIAKYIDWHQRGQSTGHHTACEGFGMVLRLYEFPSIILQELSEFLASEDFNRAIAAKFGINFDDCSVDVGIQKYLDGYEISPHPDVRGKATTFMVNINPSNKSEENNHHTHYLKLRKPYTYIQEFWSGNENIDRAWIPWTWAETIKQQKKNNSIVIFSPSNDTIHGVKASYNHLYTQRTQLYGNLWYKESKVYKSNDYCKLEWEQLDLPSKASIRQIGNKQQIAPLLLSSIKNFLKKVINS